MRELIIPFVDCLVVLEADFFVAPYSTSILWRGIEDNHRRQVLVFDKVYESLDCFGADALIQKSWISDELIYPDDAAGSDIILKIPGR